jgi:hypothetical protein
LKQLARTGAYAAAAGGGDYDVYSPRNNFAEPRGRMARQAVEEALRSGWLETVHASGRLKLTRTGLRVVRLALSGGAAQNTDKRARRKSGRLAGARPVPSNARSHPHRPLSDGSTPLHWLRCRKDKDGKPLISEVQFEAGERLSNDFLRAQLMPRVTANWSAVASRRRTRRATPGAGVELPEAVVAAQHRVRRALQAVGPELAGILIEVCCHQIGLEAAGRAEGWPQRTAKVVLRLALTRLARHYGFIVPARAFPWQQRHWGTEDYRPTLDAWFGDQSSQVLPATAS